jgi:DeoR family deoxyribose operon repressor
MLKSNPILILNYLSSSPQGDFVVKSQRVNEIILLLKRKNVVSIKELKDKFKISEMTARRDLAVLARDRVIELIPGGAIFKSPHDPESEDEDRYLVAREENVRTVEKLKVGQRAALLIAPGDTIIIDIGSTTEYIAKFIREDIPVTTLCFTLNALVELYRKKSCTIIFAGGYFHDETMMFESPEGIELISRTRADKVFVSAAGVHPELGVTTVYPHELQTKRAIMSSARQRILVVDSAKFGKTKSVYFADLKSFHTVITNSDIPEDFRRWILDQGIELITA